MIASTLKSIANIFHHHLPFLSDMLERRDPFRPDHVQLAKSLVEKGTMVCAGPYADTSGAMFIFKGVDPEYIEKEFVQKDSYFTAGLVPSHKIKNGVY